MPDKGGSGGVAARAERAKLRSDRWATFDCYGTLVDWERGITDAMRVLWPDEDGLLALYHRVEPEVQRSSALPYREVLGRCLRAVADERGLPLSEADEPALARSLPGWAPFEEVPHALHEVVRRGWRWAILSNTDPDLLEASVERIGVRPDLVVTVAEAGSYKPAHGHWREFFDRSGAEPEEHVHVGASLFHDMAPAAELGLRSVWINRLGETASVPVGAELPTLKGLPDTLDRLLR